MNVQLTGEAIIDESVIIALGARAEWAWRRLFAAMAPGLTGYARGCGNHEIADDITSETFCRAYAAIDRFSGDQHAMRAWLFAIARNVMRDCGRSAGRMQRLQAALMPGRQVVPGMLEMSDDLEAKDLFERLLGSLSARQQEVMVLRIVDDLTVDQVAYVTGMSPGSVKTHQRRAEARLRMVIAEAHCPADERKSA